ncbi:MAG: beta-propeller domain-containing protein [Patescibacteria group bacterium]
MSKKIFKLSLLLVVLAVLVSACTLPWKKAALPVNSDMAVADESLNEDVATTTNALKKFASYDELKTFLENNSAGNGNSVSTKVMSMVPQAAGLSSGATRQTAALNSGANESSLSAESTLDYSTTNNQVAGVDEADIIKTDGTYIYALVRNDLKIIKAEPAGEAAVVTTISFESRPQDIFIDGTNLAVFGSDQQIYTLGVYKSFRRQNAYTFFKVFDLSDPANPRLVRDLDFEGNYADARLIGDYAYLFTNSYGNYIDGEPLLPRVLDSGTVLANSCAASPKCFVPDVYYFDIPYDNYSFSNITAINLKDNSETISGESYLLDAGQNLYVSEKNIYITYTQYLNEYDLEQSVKRELVFPALISDDQNKISKIEAVPAYVLNAAEKKYKVAAIIDNYLNGLNADAQTAMQSSIDNGLKQKLAASAQDMEKTIIHKIAISGRTLTYQAMGEVSGQVLNQFSMDENGDYFRIATTRSPIWSRLTATPEKSYSNVYVLNSEMKVVGSLADNLATDEKIYAARFMGDRAYLVTFKQTDPLYVIGLSDVTKPVVLGAIKVPGYSTYLHPADKNGNKLIGLGRDATTDENGNVKVGGLKLALFDFTDLSQPKELDSYLIGDASSDSIALQDHKAFLYSEAKNIIVIPAVLRTDAKLSFAGSLVFSIVDNSLALKGRIDHSAGGNYSTADFWGGYGYYDNTVKRSLYINDDLFTFSNKFLKINNLTDLNPVKSLTLTAGGDDYIISPAPASQPEIVPETAPLETPSVDTGETTTTPALELPVSDAPAVPVNMVNGELVTDTSTTAVDAGAALNP